MRMYVPYGIVISVHVRVSLGIAQYCTYITRRLVFGREREGFPNCLCFSQKVTFSFLFFFFGGGVVAITNWCIPHIIPHPSYLGTNGNCRTIVMMCEILLFSHHTQASAISPTWDVLV